MDNLKNRIIELEIESVANGGSGIGRYNGIACFVPGTISGEKVKVEIINVKKNYLIGRLIDIIEESPNRIKPVCELALSLDNCNSCYCSGCQYQHIDYKKEIEIKTEQFKNLLRRFAKIEPDNILKETIPSPQYLNYRNKVTLHFDRESNRIGYYANDNSTILEVHNCPLACGDINKKIKNFSAKSAMLENNKSVTFRYTKNDGAYTFTPGTEANILLDENTVIGKFKVPLKSFFQINIYARNILIEEVMSIIKDNPTKYIFDLYAGVGVFAIAAAKCDIDKVYAADIDKNAVETGNINKKIHKCDNIKFFPFSAIKASKSVLSSLEPTKTTLILDPPRTGLEKQVMNYILKVLPVNIIYISCGPDTLCRDLKLLSTKYKVKYTRIVDMFPRTAHFESITYLSI